MILFKLVILKESESLISSIGIFVEATFRMMPSINRIVSGFQTINYYDKSLETLIHLFQKIDESISEKKNSNFMRIKQKMLLPRKKNQFLKI